MSKWYWPKPYKPKPAGSEWTGVILYGIALIVLTVLGISILFA